MSSENEPRKTEFETSETPEASPPAFSVENGLRLCVEPRPLSAGGDKITDGPVEFSLLNALTSGGQGSVYVVSDSRGGEFALKVFGDKDSARNEWEALSTYKNHRVVPVPYFAGMLQGNGGRTQWCIVMENITGQTLQEVMQERFKENGYFTAEECMRIMSPIIMFISQASTSRREDVHRDIKPSNIIIDDKGASRLIDFGFSRRDGYEEGGGRGTRGFTAPEVYCRELFVNGETVPHSNDVRIDTYGIAATLLSLLSSRMPEEDNPYEEAPRSAQELVLMHDENIRKKMYSCVKQSMWDDYGMTPSSESISNAIATSFAIVDGEIRDALIRGLSLKQNKRPTPHELEMRLTHVLSDNSLMKYLTIMARERCYAFETGFKQNVEFSEAAQYDYLAIEGEFIDALNAFNSGKYTEALPVLRKHARSGNPSAAYYLAVCLRDRLGVDEASDDEIIILMTEAAKNDNILAQNALGQLLLERKAQTEEEKSRAIEWIRQSAKDNPESGKTGFPLAKKWLKERGLEG